MTYNRILPLGLLLLSLLAAPLMAEEAVSPPPSPAETTLTKVGDPAPDFSLALLDGRNFTLSEQRGRVVLLNWFATWCPPCREEMPHLKSEVWEELGPEGLVLVSIAREETAEVVRPFVAKYGATWAFGLDPGRAAYALYAEAYIPRNTVVGRDGRILYQSEGFEAEEFAEMIAVLEAALATEQPTGQPTGQPTDQPTDQPVAPPPGPEPAAR